MIPRRAIVALCILGGFETLVVMILGSIYPTYTISFVLMMLFGLLLATPIILAWSQNEFDPFEPIILWTALYGFLYLAKPFVQIMRGIPFSFSPALPAAILVAILGLIAFYIGYFSRLGNNMAKKIPIPQWSLSSKRLTGIAWIYIIVGFIALHIYITFSGGWSVFWAQPHGLGGKAAALTAYLYQLPELMVIGFILIAECALERKIREGKHVGIRGILTLIAAGLGGVGIYTILWGSRTMYSWIILALIILVSAKLRWHPTLKQTVVGLAILFILLVLVPFYRGYLHLGPKYQPPRISLVHSIINGAFNATDEFNVYLAEVALVPTSIPYANFRFYIQLLAHPIPRLIWPNKPALFNPHWNEFLDKSSLTWGAAETMLGDFYAQRGVISVIVLCFFSGIFWKTIGSYRKREPDNRGAMLIFAILLPNMFTFLAQAPIIAFLKWMPYMLPSTILAIFLARKKEIT